MILTPRFLTFTPYVGSLQEQTQLEEECPVVPNLPHHLPASPSTGQSQDRKPAISPLVLKADDPHLAALKRSLLGPNSEKVKSL